MMETGRYGRIDELAAAIGSNSSHVPRLLRLRLRVANFEELHAAA